MKNNIIKIILVVVVFLIALFGMSKLLDDNKKKEENEPKVTADSKKFKTEYEEFNGKKTSSGNNYLNISINESNAMRYATLDELMNLLEDGTGVIYFGFPTCPWCRNAVPVLLDVAATKKLSTIYYYDLTDIKNLWSVIDGVPTKTKEEKVGYYDLLNALDSILDEYIITDEDGIEYGTGENRIYNPLIVFVKDGEIIGHHSGTMPFNEGQTAYDSLTDTQKDALKNIYSEYMDEVLASDYCDDKCE